MKPLKLIALLISLGLTAPAHAVDFWHSSTVWMGRGMCSSEFTFDSGATEIENLQVSVSVIDTEGEAIDSGKLVIESFGSSNADRYATAFLEGEAMCEDNLTIKVTKATAIIEGKRVDLLKSNNLSVRDFNPFKITIQK